MRIASRSRSPSARGLALLIRIPEFLNGCAVAVATAAPPATTRTNLSAAEIVDKNVAARGGLQAWRAVQAISMQGKLGAGGNKRAALPAPLPGKKDEVLPTDPRPAEEVQLPFVMEMERPLKVRFELQFKGQTAVQVFDGANGWKLRPYLNRLQVEPYSAEEMKKASMQSQLDGPLVDYAAKGNKVELDGVDKVDGGDTYKLGLTPKNGQLLHVWIDAQTFLETKIEGQPRKLYGVEHPVEVYYRDYRPVSGLQIPFVLETKVLPVSRPDSHVKETAIPAEKITIEKVVVNPKLKRRFISRPILARRFRSRQQKRDLSNLVQPSCG